MTSAPSVTARSESSGPSSRSSTTIFLPLRPKRSWTSIASIAPSDCSMSAQTITPLPRARPSALTATRPPRSRAQAFAGAGWVKTSKSAVGMPARFINAFAKDLLDSMRPAPRSGPKTLKPAWRRASATPASTAASGPSTLGLLEHGLCGDRHDLAGVPPVHGFGLPSPVAAATRSPGSVRTPARQQQIDRFAGPRVGEHADHPDRAQAVEEVVVPVVRPVDVQPLRVDDLAGPRGLEHVVFEQQLHA